MEILIHILIITVTEKVIDDYECRNENAMCSDITLVLDQTTLP